MTEDNKQNEHKEENKKPQDHSGVMMEGHIKIWDPETGEVIEVDRNNNRIKVKGSNIIKKHVKTTKEKKGGIFEKENFIHISNVAILKKEKKKEASK